MIIVAPSVLSADFSKLGAEIEKVKNAKAQWLHFDVMDGSFVPNISFGQPVLKSVRKCTDMFLDVHLMIDEPHRYVADFRRSGADMLTIHFEAESAVADTLISIREQGMKAGLAIKPGTDVKDVLHLLPLCDMLLVMTVEPGFGGQSFMEDMMVKVAAARGYITENGLDCLIQVDGGINEKTVKTAYDAGADVFVAGSYIFGAADVNAAVGSLFAAEG